jgi:peptidoglycan/xylan/chitin deacetylase (PgdA/CDA1 family)
VTFARFYFSLSIKIQHMTPNSRTSFNFVKFSLTISLVTVLLSACTAANTAQPTADMNAALTQVVATMQAGATQTAQVRPATPVPSATFIPEPTAVRTPPVLPGVYISPLLNPLDTPHTYIQDTCQVLKAKWDPNNAAPGTVLMPIMFHSITKGEVKSADQISLTEFHKLMNDLHEMGFQAVTMQQAADFLTKNAKIPQRSVLLIVDDRKYRAYFDLTFKDFYDQWGWKVVNAWISHPDTLQQVWDENAALESEGWVDHQAHGVIHNINMNDNSSDEFLKGELQGSIDAMQLHFNKKPIAIVWPGGDFGLRPVQAARQFGYQLGFTINPRGPLLFNWIPLSDAADPARPSYIPDGPIGDPLMTLPRYWDTDARAHIDTVRNIGDQAAAFAEQNKVIELEYYDILCKPVLGPIAQP